jgi:hypothetical protein
LQTIKILFSVGEDAQIYKVQHILGENYKRLSPDLGDGIAIDDANGCLSLIPKAIVTLLDDPNTVSAINSFSR